MSNLRCATALVLACLLCLPTWVVCGRGGREGGRTEGHQREEGAEPVHDDEEEVDADDAAATLPHLVVGREKAGGEEDGGDDADDDHGVADSAVVEWLWVG